MFPAPPPPPLPLPVAPLSTHVPIGSVVAYMGAVARQQKPTFIDGVWMVCDGSPLSATAYPELFAVIGTSYGGANGTFSLPDLQGYFLRGIDPTGKVDQDVPGRAVGSIEWCAVQDHVHALPTPVPPVTAQPGATTNAATTQNPTEYVDVSPPPTMSPPPYSAPSPLPPSPTTPPTVYVSPTETRPVNVAVYYIIKVKSVASLWPASFSAAPGSGG